jgi:hypothetical protein
MLTEHTQGPWSFIIEDDACFVVPPGPDGHMIARCRGPNRIGNAKMIAAALELLAACTLALPACKDELLAQVFRDAIAKATL